MLQPPEWDEISDEDLARELDHVHQKRSDTFRTGHAGAWANLLDRTAQLEAEYLRRFPKGVVEAAEKLRGYEAQRTAGS